VVKLASDAVAHKTELGAVHVGLGSERDVRRAVGAVRALGDRVLVEQMVTGSLVELLVGVRRDPQVGVALTVGAGGTLTELLRDTATLLLPASYDEVLEALRGLRVWPLLHGFRAGPAAPGRAPVPDVEATTRAVVTAVLAVAEVARDLGDALVELEVNPLLACPTRAVAVDALLRVDTSRSRGLVAAGAALASGARR
jgi:acetyl-CoA synthetase